MAESVTCRVYYDGDEFKTIEARSFAFKEPTASLKAERQVEEGSIAEFTCASNGYPAPHRFFWSVNNGPEEESDSNTKRIKIKRRRNDENIQIICRAESKFNGNIYSDSDLQNVAVLWGPLLDPNQSKKETIQINEDEPVDLNCAFTGYPKPSVTWVLFQNGQGVQKRPVSSSNMDSYQIMSAGKDHNGLWKCVARNSATNREVVREIELNVLRKPDIFQIKQIESEKKEKPMLKCMFKFRFNNNEIFEKLSWSRSFTGDGGIERFETIQGKLCPVNPNRSCLYNNTGE